MTHLASLPAVWPEAKPAMPEIVPPHNYEAEQGLLGAMLVNNRCIERVRDLVADADFADPAHGRIFHAILRLADTGTIANSVTLKRTFDQDGGLADVGGAAYLVKLAASVVAIVNAEDYARTIRDLAVRRKLIAAALDTIADAHAQEFDREATDIAAAAEARMREAGDAGTAAGELVPVSGIVTASLQQTEAARQAGGVAGLATGLKALDRILGGLFPGEMTIIAGRPGMAKTDIGGVNIPFYVASEGGVVALFQQDMSSDPVAKRLLARDTGISAMAQRLGQVNAHDILALTEAAKRIQALGIAIDDTPHLPVNAMLTRARRLKAQRGRLDLIVVDYLQLTRPMADVAGAGVGFGGSRAGFGNRQEEVAAISRGLKWLAKKAEAPVLALAQLSRAVEAREDKRPMMQDLRESGQIEQDAENIVFAYRDSYYLERAEPARRPDESDEKYLDRYERWQEQLKACRNVLELIVGKSRLGPTGTAKQFYDPVRSYVGDLQEP